jgi:hypothetical protein
MKRLCAWAAFAAVLTLGGWGDFARADGPIVEGEAAGDSASSQGESRAGLHHANGATHPLWNRVAKHFPLGCWSHHNAYTCSSLKSELVYVFGSCRSFYGEGCLKGPPPGEPGSLKYGTAVYDGPGSPSQGAMGYGPRGPRGDKGGDKAGCGCP